jgi:UDP-N-acetylglucosamine 2-epimerase
VIDVGYERAAIARGIDTAQHDMQFRAALEQCVNPYGDGHTAPRTVNILKRLRLTPALLSKWIASGEPLLS